MKNSRQMLLWVSLCSVVACGMPDQQETEIPIAGNGEAIVMNAASPHSARASFGGPMTVRYTLDETTIFANPERGFYHHEETDGTSPLSQSQLKNYRTSEGISLILRLFYLDAFRTTSISTSYLDAMRTDFARVRGAGVKTIVRFAYTSSMDKPYGDAARDRVLGHIAQLKPILQANADVIATVQVGFIGAWGEWYYTDHFGDEDRVSATQIADRKAVVEALLGCLPATRTVQVRTPTWKKRFYGNTALDEIESRSGSARSRVGHHNDCFLASADDEGTYANVTVDKAYLASENQFVPQGGETCATSSYSGWSNASVDLERLHYSYLNRDYLGAVFTSWGSGLEVARRRLGYRLALVETSAASDVQPGGEVNLTVKLRNDGYAAPFNPRGLELVARHTTTGARLVARLAADPRRFTPGATHQIDTRLCMPAGTPEGTYALALSLPDPEPTLHDKPEYSIRLANSGTWDAATGTNSLSRNLIVTATSGSPSCTAGSVSFGS